MANEKRSARATSFAQGIALNFASLVVLGASGVALNVVISRFYDAEALGVFNQVMAAYVVGSMLASGGLPLAVLRAVAANGRDASSRPSILLGAFAPAVVLASFVTIGAWLLAPLVGEWLDSRDVAVGLRVVTPGLFFFALNKTLLAVVNGLERMRAYAAYQSLRYLLILLALVLAVLVDAPSAWLPGVFSVAEVVLFCVLTVEVSSQVSWWRGRDFGPWVGAHARYGLRAVLSGLLVELNSRVDVLMIGYFMTDRDVGIYSFAVLFAEGFFQILVVLQNSYNPILADALGRQDKDRVVELARRARRWIYPSVAAVGVTSILLYPIVLRVLTGRPELVASHLPYAIVIAGIALGAGDLPFLHVLSMGGLPGWHTGLMLSMVLVNIAGNAILIPMLGILGAATATSLAFVAVAIMLRIVAWRTLALRL